MAEEQGGSEPNLAVELDKRLLQWFQDEPVPRVGSHDRERSEVPIVVGGEKKTGVEDSMLETAAGSGDWAVVHAWVEAGLFWDHRCLDSDTGHVFGLNQVAVSLKEGEIGFLVRDVTHGREYGPVAGRHWGFGTPSPKYLQGVVATAKKRG
jgi:hypothetical protein